jgi:hypothetical protein
MCRLLHNHHVFCVPFSEKLNNLLDRLDNQHTVHGSQNDVLEWVRLNRNDARTVAVQRFIGYKYLHRCR